MQCFEIFGGQMLPP